MVKRICYILSSLIIGTVFLISAISKLQTLEQFTWSFLDILPISTITANVLSRLFIVLELYISISFLLSPWLKKFTIMLCLATMVLLSTYLLRVYLTVGNNGNCGCFGNWIYMHPLTAFFKNLVLIGLVSVVYFLHKPYSNSFALPIVILILSVSATFLIRPLPGFTNGVRISSPVDLNSLYSEYSYPKPDLDLRRGKQVIGYFSVTCRHCRKAAFLFQLMYHQNRRLPLYMVLGGRRDSISNFFESSKSSDVPHSYLSSDSAFLRMSGQYLPAIYWIENSIKVRQLYLDDLDPADIDDWIRH